MNNIEPMLACSTAHITESDSKILEANTEDNCTDEYFPMVIWDKKPYGWFVYINELDEDTKKAIEETGLSPDFYNLLKYATEKGCRWLMLDCDAAPIPDLPQHSW